MNSPFANIFLAIQAQLASLTNTDGTPMLPHIDQDLQQFVYDDNPPVSFPCGLIDVAETDFTNQSELVQDGMGLIVISLGFAPYSNTQEGTPTQYKEKALNYYEIEWEVNKALHGWTPPVDHCGALSRRSVMTDKRRIDYRVRRLTYSFAFEDYSTEEIITKVAASFKVTSQFID